MATLQSEVNKLRMTHSEADCSLELLMVTLAGTFINTDLRDLLDEGFLHGRSAGDAEWCFGKAVVIV